MTFLIGVLAGLRALTPAAATAWAVRLGWLQVPSPLALIGSLPIVIVLTLLAIGEPIGDKLPNTPARTALPGLVKALNLPDIVVALGEDAVAIAGALWVVSRF